MQRNCHAHVLDHGNPKEQSDTHTLRARLSLEIGLWGWGKQSGNQIINESAAVEAWLWRQRELLLMFPIQVHMLRGNR